MLSNVYSYIGSFISEVFHIEFLNWKLGVLVAGRPRQVHSGISNVTDDWLGWSFGQGSSYRLLYWAGSQTVFCEKKSINNGNSKIIKE